MLGLDALLFLPLDDPIDQYNWIPLHLYSRSPACTAYTLAPAQGQDAPEVSIGSQLARSLPNPLADPLHVI